MIKARHWIPGLLCLLFSAAAMAEYVPVPGERITQIVFEGNEVTRERILRAELHVFEGDTPDLNLIEKSRQSMMDLGIFESVATEVRADNGNVILVFKIEEPRFYILPIPRLSVNSQGETSYGIKVEWDNVAGLNQTLDFIVSQKTSAREDEGTNSRFGIGWDYPAVADSRFDVGVSADYNNTPKTLERASGEVSYQEREIIASVRVSRRLSDRGQTDGWVLTTGLFLWNRENSPSARVPDLVDGFSPGVLGGARYRQLNLQRYSETGLAFNYDVRSNLPIERDFSFFRQTATLLWLLPGVVDDRKRPHHNIALRFAIGTASGGPGGFVPFDLDSDVVRAHRRDDAEGDMFVSLSAEYRAPVFGTKSVRAFGFFDVGNVYAGRHDFCPCELASTIGLGIAWRPKAFVGLELRVGVGYAIDKNAYRAVGGTERVP